MAREGYRSLYGDLTKLKDRSLLDDPAGGADFDDELWELLAASSSWVDRYCNRHFYVRTETVLLDGGRDGVSDVRLFVPDLVALTTLKADETADLEFEVVWDTTDYFLLPYNAAPTQFWGEPYTSLVARAKGDESEGFLGGQQNYELVGRWGYREFSEASGSLINNGAGYSATATSITVDSGTDFAVGQTLLIGTEQLLVTAIAANALTVVRALNGTIGATIADDDPVNIIRWPPSVERAALITAARLWTRAPAFEPSFVDNDVDTDVRLLLDPYKKLVV